MPASERAIGAVSAPAPKVPASGELRREPRHQLKDVRGRPTASDPTVRSHVNGTTLTIADDLREPMIDPANA
jgi:hypothetical protein